MTLGPQFVYVAAYEGGIVTDNAISGLNKKLDLTIVPAVTFMNPSVATVGLTEEQAKEKGYEVKTSVLPLDAVPRAIVNRETTGVFKLVADANTLKVLGVHIVSKNAGDVIYAATLAVKFGLTIGDLIETLAPYLTMAEGLKLAALTFDKDVSKLSCCAGVRELFTILLIQVYQQIEDFLIVLKGALVKQSLQKEHFHTILRSSIIYKCFMGCSKSICAHEK